MESVNLRHLSSASKISTVDVSQLDKINAILNKNADNALMEGLGPEDQLYISALLDNGDSSTDSDDEEANAASVVLQNSGWPSMPISSSRLSSRRMKKLRTPYAITLSLEDLSYIRPAWGISKGVRTIKFDKRGRKGGPRLPRSPKIQRKTSVAAQQTVKQGPEGSESSPKDESGAGGDQDSSEAGSKPATKYSSESVLSYVLALSSILMLLIVMPLYLMDQRSAHDRLAEDRLRLATVSRQLEIFKPDQDRPNPKRLLKVHFGRGIPRNLKPDDCTCDTFVEETRRYDRSNSTTEHPDDVVATCVACLDWAFRANLRIYVERPKPRPPGPADETATPGDELPSNLRDGLCYNIKWQSYDTLQTPLVDCFSFGRSQWFGLGDSHASESWTLEGQEFQWTPLVSNNWAEFGDEPTNGHPSKSVLGLGAYVNLTLFSSNGIFVGDLKSDFLVSIATLRPTIPSSSSSSSSPSSAPSPYPSAFPSSLPSSAASPPPGPDKDKWLCLSAGCTDRCTQAWSRADHLDELRYRNNQLEYRICSAGNMQSMVSRRLAASISRRSSTTVRTTDPPTGAADRKMPPGAGPLDEGAARNGVAPGGLVASLDQSGSDRQARRDRFAEFEPQPQSQSQPQRQPANRDQLAGRIAGSHLEPGPAGPNKASQPSPHPGIGLIERTIFATSPESMQTLDGQTLRQFVDNIVRLNLKTSSILLIDARWETYVGSLKLNTALFPKAKLLFEILHNKGFKVVLTIKPYVDAGIGNVNIHQLWQANRLYMASYLRDGALTPYAFHRQTAALGMPSAQALSSSSSSSLSDPSSRKTPWETFVMRRHSLLGHQNETISVGSHLNSSHSVPLLFKCREAHEGLCLLLDLTRPANRDWMLGNIRRSSLLMSDTDGILFAGGHPNGLKWELHFRRAMSELVHTLTRQEPRIYTLGQQTGDFGYIELAPRPLTWPGLRSMINSVLNMGLVGFPLVHPGPVWGRDQRATLSPSDGDGASSSPSSEPEPEPMGPILRGGMGGLDVYGGYLGRGGRGGGRRPPNPFDEELVVRWLQVAVFLPILQFENMAPIELLDLQELTQNLTRIRRLQIVPELKRHLPPTRLINRAPTNGQPFAGPPPPPPPPSAEFQPPEPPYQLPLIRPVWMGIESGGEGVVADQFGVGPDVIVAPILSKGQTQRDIYLPNGFWRDELRQTTIRGGRWLRNYGIDLNEVAWFVRTRR